MFAPFIPLPPLEKKGFTMRYLTMKNLNAIAKVTHQANKAYCESLGDFSQVDWDAAPEWQQESAIKGVWATVTGEAATPQDQHQSWMDEKIANGWVYGPMKDATLKTHPCLVPYDQLPAEQRRKDHLFRAIVQALTEEV